MYKHRDEDVEVFECCDLCGEWLWDEENDPDLREIFIGQVICFRCAHRWNRVFEE
jgi:hypothetical protein